MAKEKGRRTQEKVGGCEKRGGVGERDKERGDSGANTMTDTKPLVSS